MQQAGFGALVGREGVELVVADGAEEDGVGVERDVDGLVGSGEPFAVMATPPRRASAKVKSWPPSFGDGVEDVDGFVGDFGADAVAGEDCNLELHGCPVVLAVRQWRFSC